MLHIITSFLMFFGILSGPVFGTVKRCRYNTNWSDPNNWSLGNVPTEQDTTVFTEKFRDLAVLLPEGRTKIWELVAPLNGLLLFPRSGSLEVLGANSDTIFTEIFVEANNFLRNEPLEWLNPESWVTEDNRSLKAVPHTERIPCRHDIVELPGNVSFGLTLPRWPITVAGIKFGNRIIGQSTWKYIVDKTEGGKVFIKGPASIERSQLVEIQADSCSDSSGCPCSSARQDPDGMDQLICSYVKPFCEKEPPLCLLPIQPLGHCCSICGAYIHVKYDAGKFFSINRLRLAVKDFLLKEGLSEKILAHVSKTRHGKVQIVLVDQDKYLGDSVAAAPSLQHKLQNNPQLAIQSATLLLAGPPVVIATWFRALAPIFGSLLLVIVLFSLAFLYQGEWHCLPLNAVNEGSFIFARFENTDTESENVQVVAQGYDTPTNQAFHNPMYDQKATASSATVYSELQKQDIDIIDSAEKAVDMTEESVDMTMVDLTSTSAED